MKNPNDDYAAHAQRQNAAAALAEQEWLAGASQAVRDRLLPFSKAAREELGEEDDASGYARSHRDVAAEVDTVSDQLIEAFDLTPGQAEGIVEWHLARLNVEVEREKSLQIGRIVGILIKPAHDIRVKIIGLAFAAKLDALNGLGSQAAAGKELGLERATVSHWKRFWQKLLGLKDETFGKKEESRKKMSVARLNVVARQREERAASR